MSSATSHIPAPLHGRSREGSHGLRPHIGVLLHRSRLDRMLAEGADPAASRELSLRARQITKLSYRCGVAEGFERALAATEGPSARLSSAVPPAKYEVRAARAALLELFIELRERASVEPAGVALAKQILTDGASPLYIESRNDALWKALRRATAALDGS
ncbi:MAG TPA: hypothetical protein VED41_00835 [Solirubrobacteraceae bacterium]|nr:hypothetical protein [Solirubrobacteraceae bacterium]